MNRRRLTYLCVAFVLLGGVIAAWLPFANRDADFHVIGRKTPRVRQHYALLDHQVDVADFHDCRTLNETLKRLHQKLQDDGHDPNGQLAWIGQHPGQRYKVFAQECGLNNLGASPVHFAAHSQAMTVKQFLRDVFRQAGAADAQFIVRNHCIEPTTLNRVRAEQAEYIQSVPVYDRIRNSWKDMIGHVEVEPIRIYPCTDLSIPI